MKTKHTPGKWKQDGLYIDAPDGSVIATVHSEDSIENEANGKLIASAPQMLNELIWIKDSIIKGRTLNSLSKSETETYNRLLLIIKKATE